MQPQKIGNYKIPFDQNGNQLTYAAGWRDIEWRENDPFNDELTYVGYERGRSAAHLVFHTATGKRVTMFLGQFDRCAQHMNGGKFKGTFRFVKRGENYGVAMIDAAS